MLVKGATDLNGAGDNFMLSTVHWLQTEHFDGLMQERCNSSALAMELRLSCTNPSICRP